MIFQLTGIVVLTREDQIQRSKKVLLDAIKNESLNPIERQNLCLKAIEGINAIRKEKINQIKAEATASEIKLSDEDIVKDLVRYSLDVTDENGCTPLMVAVQYRRTECISLLHTHHADVNFQNLNKNYQGNGLTPLMTAAKIAHAGSVRELINARPILPIPKARQRSLLLLLLLKLRQEIKLIIPSQVKKIIFLLLVCY